MVVPLWKKLKVLVEIDQKQEAIFQQIEKALIDIDEDHLIIPELEKKIAQIRRASLDAKKNVHAQELEANQLREQEKEKRSILERIKHQKEVVAIEKELRSSAAAINEQEDALFQAWHQLEVAQKQEEIEIPKTEEKIKLLKAEIVEKEKAVTELEHKEEEIEKERQQYITSIPEEWVTRYEQMKNKVADPVVPIIHTSCSSCYYSVTAQELARLRLRAIIPCRSCYRLLYYDQEEEKDSEQASF